MAWVFVAMSDALVDGFGQLGHAREHASAQTLRRDVAEECPGSVLAQRARTLAVALHIRDQYHGSIDHCLCRCWNSTSQFHTPPEGERNAKASAPAAENLNGHLIARVRITSC